MRRSGEQCLVEHAVRCSDAEEGTSNLRDDVERDVLPADTASQRVGQRDGRVEVRSGDRPKGEEERDERCTSRDRVREQSERDVSSGEVLSHDPGANDGSYQQRRAEAFADRVPRRARSAPHDQGFRARMKALITAPSRAATASVPPQPDPHASSSTSPRSNTRVGSTLTPTKPARSSPRM